MVPREIRRLRHQLACQRRALEIARKRKNKHKVVAVPHRGRKKAFVRKVRLIPKAIACPSVLDFDDEPKGTAFFFHQLDTLLGGYSAAVEVDHRPLTKVSPAAALVLIAHLYRAKRRKPDLELSAHLPETGEPRDMLGEIGYYRYFKDFDWKRPSSTQRFFFEHRRGEKVMPEFAEKMCEHWRSTDPEKTQRLYAALVEGMGNATEWAYGGRTDGYRWWWMLGYRDAQTGEIAYSLYDQGLGIPATIRRKRNFLDFLPGLRPSDSELVERAVVEGRFSRSRQKGRGTGLPVLWEFVKDGADGELLIFTNTSRCVFRHEKPILRDEYTIGLRGTLISWNFRAS